MGVSGAPRVTQLDSRNPATALRGGTADVGTPVVRKEAFGRWRGESPMTLAAGAANRADIARRGFRSRWRVRCLGCRYQLPLAPPPPLRPPPPEKLLPLEREDELHEEEPLDDQPLERPPPEYDHPPWGAS